MDVGYSARNDVASLTTGSFAEAESLHCLYPVILTDSSIK
jgi:hypothetical protein